MKRKGFLTLGMVLTLLCALGASAPVTSKGTGQKKMIPPKKPLLKPIKLLLPDLVVERIWLDNQGYINFSLKNVGKGRMPDREHLLGVVRVKWGKDQENFFFERRSSRKKPPVDPKGVLKAPGGKLKYNTKIRLSSSVKVSVFVDSTEKIAEANEKNNSKVATLTPLKVISRRAEEIKPFPSIRGAPLGSKGLKPLGGEGGLPDLVIRSFEIKKGPQERERERIWWGDKATYIYNGGGEHEDISFLVAVDNIGPVDFEGTFSITVYCGSIRVNYPTPYTVIRIRDSRPAGPTVLPTFVITLHQSDFIERGLLRPGRYHFKAKIGTSIPPDADTSNNYSENRVTLILRRPRSHPVVRAIPIETFTLESDPALTGSVAVSGNVYEHIEASSRHCRGFISFDLSPLYKMIDKWRREGWTGFEVKSATLEIVQLDYGNWDKAGDILLDWLDYGESLTSSDYDAPMFTNLYTFHSNPGTHSFLMAAYVRDRLQRNQQKVQFRLRLADETLKDGRHNVYTRYQKPCRLIIKLSPRRPPCGVPPPRGRRTLER